MNGNGTVLVTGAGGFVGSAIVRRLVEAMTIAPPAFWDGTPVRHVAAVLRPNGSDVRLEALPRSSDWSIHRADLADASSLQHILAAIQPRAIVHAAIDAKAHEELSDDELRRLNLAPLEAFFEDLRTRHSTRFIHAGSAWVLQAGDRLREDAPIGPQSPYAMWKALADARIPQLGRQTGVGWINLRLFNIFGRYESPSRLLPHLVSCLSEGRDARLSHGTQVRDFTDVDDMAAAFLLALSAPEDACGRVYHVGSGRGTSVQAFAHMVAEFTGHASRIHFAGTTTMDQELDCLVADPSLAHAALGWPLPSPDDLRGRIRRAVSWWIDRRAAPSAPIGRGPSA